MAVEYWSGTSGNDSKNYFGNKDLVAFAKAGDDFVWGNTGDDQLYGDNSSSDEGSDTLKGWSGNDITLGMGGDDYLYGESGDDTVGASTHWDEGGNDYLDGGSGDDMLQGGSGSDDLNGGTDNDILIGVYDFTAPQNSIQPQYNAGQYEYDTLTGGDGADTFVLGNSVEAFYNNDGFSGYAEITDFNWAEGDKFQVFGSLDDYTTSEFGGGIDIYYQNDLIAWVSNTTDVIPSEDFIFA